MAVFSVSFLRGTFLNSLAVFFLGHLLLLLGGVTMKDDIALDQWSNKARLCSVNKDGSEVWQHGTAQSEDEAA